MDTHSLLLTTLLTLGLAASPAQAADFNFIPQPVSVNATTGHFVLSPTTTVWANTPEAQQVAEFFATKVNAATAFGITTSTRKGGSKTNCVKFVIDPSFNNNITSAAYPDCQQEAYNLSVDTKNISITAQNADGLFRGLQTLLQLLPPEVEKTGATTSTTGWKVPAININDAPRFAYRGIMLDPCRHWLPAADVKRIIDVLATYKFNRIHWHLTDDQGWRVESERYPQLNRIASFRTEADGTTHGGYYTKDEIRSIVAYAKERHIEIVPELEMPGHELAAIATMPQLSCRGENITPRIIWGVEDIVMCPGKELMFEFLQNEIDEFTELFPYRYFHIGGDESPRGEWKNCPNCQKRMASLGYTKEAQLQDYIIERMASYLNTKGKTIIGWDEILEGGNLDPSAVVMSWRGEDGGIEAAKKNHHVLMTPGSRGLYFDHFQGDPIAEPNAIGGYSTLQKVYSYDPVPEELKREGKDAYVLGVQANNWSEYIHNPEMLEFRMFPRALALAEIAWSPVESRDFADFQRRVDGDATLRLDAHKINYHIPVPEQVGGAQCNHIAFTDSYTLSLTSTRPETIVYTLDASEPSATSNVYSEPLTFTHTATVKARCMLPNGQLGATRTFSITKDVWHEPACNATHCDKAEQGVRLRVAYGDYDFSANVPACAWTIDSIAPKLESVREVVEVPASVRNVKNYAATAECFIDIPEDGIYEFFTLNSQLWLDGNLHVDNRALFIPRMSYEGRQIALKAGRHHLKTLFIGGIFNGWPTYWDAAHVQYRKQGVKDWTIIKPEQCSVPCKKNSETCKKSSEVCKKSSECRK